MSRALKPTWPRRRILNGRSSSTPPTLYLRVAIEVIPHLFSPCCSETASTRATLYSEVIAGPRPYLDTRIVSASLLLFIYNHVGQMPGAGNLRCAGAGR